MKEMPKMMDKLTNLLFNTIEDNVYGWDDVINMNCPEAVYGKEKAAFKSAEITKDVAIKFAKYVDSSSFYYNEKEIWKSTATEDVKTNDELFEEFLKQYNGTIK